MTLIVGIQCSDGVVVGSDSGATFVTGNLGIPGNAPTAMQPTSKLHVIQDRLVMGVSGPVGLGQLYVDGIQKLFADGGGLDSNMSIADMQRLLQRTIWQDAKDAIGMNNALFGANAIGMVATHSLIAAPVGSDSRPVLFQCDLSGKTEAATSELPTVAVGSGQPIADPFLTLLRRIFWSDTAPTLVSGIFATVWTLQQAIQVSPGGLSGPIVISTVDANGARILPTGVIEDHLHYVEDFEQRMKDILSPPEIGAKIPMMTDP